MADAEASLRVLTAYFDALAALDARQIAAVFAEDGEIEDPVGTPVRRGREQIGEYFAQGLCQAAASVRIEVLAALPAGGSVAAHWRMVARGKSGHEATVEGIDVLQVDPDSLIARAEGYWDQQGFRRALSGS
ncbi:nuclear transport factor 2 family protein [Amnibacterium sp. CER49]|uniref:nuclear transport factor 2 family protein n=1 Tax=Amnibacterium sp. CER49 TaxID=3039161 RepID=UPI002446D79D|nr:nuclear transport factor 2 family protein [Amnibacterium sp. CER49]MDH2445134.1 nuclear transport factor 2 family protein [Amnibacterium sp. CER49]